METVFEFCLNSFIHFLKRSHPHKPIYGDAFFAMCEWCVKKGAAAMCVKLCESGFKPKQYARIRSEQLVWYAFCLLYERAHFFEHRLVSFLCHGIATEVWQHGAFASATYSIFLYCDII